MRTSIIVLVVLVALGAASCEKFVPVPLDAFPKDPRDKFCGSFYGYSSYGNATYPDTVVISKDMAVNDRIYVNWLNGSRPVVINVNTTVMGDAMGFSGQYQFLIGQTRLTMQYASYSHNIPASNFSGIKH